MAVDVERKIKCPACGPVASEDTSQYCATHLRDLFRRIQAGSPNPSALIPSPSLRKALARK